MLVERRWRSPFGVRTRLEASGRSRADVQPHHMPPSLSQSIVNPKVVTSDPAKQSPPFLSRWITASLSRPVQKTKCASPLEHDSQIIRPVFLLVAAGGRPSQPDTAEASWTKNDFVHILRVPLQHPEEPGFATLYVPDRCRVPCSRSHPGTIRRE